MGKDKTVDIISTELVFNTACATPASSCVLGVCVVCVYPNVCTVRWACLSVHSRPHSQWEVVMRILIG